MMIDNQPLPHTSAFCLCGNTSLVRMNRPRFSNGRSLYRCISCGLYQLYPYPIADSSDLSIYANPAYLNRISEAEYRGYFMALHDASLGGLVHKDLRVLDFGAGHCYYQKFFSEMGVTNVFSCEVNPHLVEFAQNHLHLANVVSSLSELPTNYFDLIIANQVFEHLFDPVETACAALWPLLASNGRLVFTVPNAASLNRVLLGDKWIGYSPDEHIWFFDKHSAIKVFSNSKKFVVENIKVKSAVNTRHDRFTPSSIVKRIYYQSAMRVFELIGRGDQLIVTLQKQ